MRLRYLGSGGSNHDGCPTLYATDEDSYVVVGWRTETVGKVEIPHLLTGFAEPRSYIGAMLSDTGRGMFALCGRPVTDHETLAQMKVEDHETAIVVEKKVRTYFGVPADS